MTVLINQIKYYLLSAMLFMTAWVQASVVDMYIRDDVHDDYHRFLAGRDVLDIESFSGPYIRRDVVDMILIQQALKLGGFERKFVYRPGNVNFRNSNLLLQGKQLLSFDSYWLSDAQAVKEKLFISDAVVRRGEYLAGIFYSPLNEKVSQINTLSDLRKLTAISTPKWRTDWSTLTSLPLKKVLIENDWQAQARSVHEQWVDFMLMPLMPSLNNEFKLGKIYLKAHPRLVVLLDDSRHFVVSKLHPDGEAAFKALQKGLSILRQEQRIYQAYLEAGFIPDLTRYQQLN